VTILTTVLDALGLQKIQVENKTQEAIKLVYADNDIVREYSFYTKFQNTTVKTVFPKFIS
jgi:hypothetical protein